MMQIDFFQSIISNCISDYHLSSSFIHSVLRHTYAFFLVGFKFSRLTFPELLYQSFRYESFTFYTQFFFGGGLGGESGGNYSHIQIMEFFLQIAGWLKLAFRLLSASFVKTFLCPSIVTLRCQKMFSVPGKLSVPP